MTTETLKNPTIPTLPDPIGIDFAIQRLQQSIGTLEWLGKSFGRAWTIPRQVLNEKVVEPMCYQGTKEYYPVLPNDALKSYSFWRVSGGRSAEEYRPNMNTGGAFIFKDSVDLIVWVNLKRIDPTKNYIFKEELIRDVMVKLNRDPNVEVVRVYDDKADEIFKGYSLKPQHRDLLMYPFDAFRIEMFLSYQFVCNAISVIPEPEGIYDESYDTSYE
jgi:hypothetical protein